MTYYSALHYAAKAKKSEEKAAEYLQQVGNKVTTVEGNIGDIGFAPLGIDESQNKRRYLNGQVISQAQFTSFTKKIKAAINITPNLATSETNWQAEVTNSKLGQCGKFVIDDTLGTIRLPKVVNINGLQDLSLLGGIKAESLPNITGTAGKTNSANVDGSFYKEEVIAYSSQSGESGNAIKFDASRSSSTYQDNAPVQQEAILYPYFIQVATGVEESVDVTREIELNNPFSLLDYKWSEYELNNASWLLSNGAFHSGATYVAVYELLLKIYNGTETKDGVSVKLSTESYEDTDFVLNTDETTFRLPIKVKLASGNAVIGNGMALGLTNGSENYGATTWNSSSARAISARLDSYGKTIPSKSSSDTYPTDGANLGVTTDPLKSGIETSSNSLKLYFYVGETIQDANVIVASQVLTKVANCIDRTVKSDKETVVGWGMPDYSAGVVKSNSGFTSDKKQWMKIQRVTKGYEIIVYVNGQIVDDGGIGGTTSIQSNETHWVLIDNNDIITTTIGTNATLTLTVYPMKGVN